MVDEKKRPEVELDLEDVKETTIQLDGKKEEKKEPNLNLGEVDLGYASHDSKKEKVDVDVIEKEEAKETVKADKPADAEDLSTYSEGIQKRIDKLTRKMREAERREQAALDYAQGLQKKYNDTQKKFQEVDESYVKQYDARIDAEKDAVKKKLKEAIETQNPEAIISANEESGICPDLLDLTDHQKDFLVTAALKSGNELIKASAIEVMINDYGLADALDSAMFKATDSEIVDNIRNNLYAACE